MTPSTDETKEVLKKQIKLARATGLLTGAKTALKCFGDDVAKDSLIMLIDEVLELLK